MLNALITRDSLADEAPEPQELADAPDELAGAHVPHVTIHAFGESAAFADLWQRAASDRRLASATTELREGGFAAAARRYTAERSPDLIIVESRADGEALGLQVDSLADVCGPTTRLIVVGHQNDIGLYRRLLGMGVSSYLVAPVGIGALITAISDIYREPGREKIGRITAVLGAKGGVGASVLAQSLALELSQRLGSDVLLADLDLAFGTAGLNLDVEPNQGLVELIDEAERIDTAMLDRVVVRRGQHLAVLAAAAGLDRNHDIDEYAIERVLEVAQAHIRHVVLDIPHLWARWVERALVAADRVVIVTTPEIGSLRNAVALSARIAGLRPNDPAPHLILNQVGMPGRKEITARDVARVLRLEPALSVPFDAKALSLAAARGRMVAEVARRGPVAQAVGGLATLVAPEAGPAPRRWSLPRLRARSRRS